MLPLLFLIGFGMHSAWRQQDGSALINRLKWIGIAAVVIGVAIPTVVYGRFGALVAAGCVAALWVMLAFAGNPSGDHCAARRAPRR